MWSASSASWTEGKDAYIRQGKPSVLRMESLDGYVLYKLVLAERTVFIIDIFILCSRNVLISPLDMDLSSALDFSFARESAYACR